MAATHSTRTAPSNALTSLVGRSHHDPHTLLGLHATPSGQKIIRLWRPDAKVCYIELNGAPLKAQLVHRDGFFEVSVPAETTPGDYLVYHTSGLKARDPYTFAPWISETDQYLFGCGTHYGLYHVLGAHADTIDGVEGVRFAVWAPSARSVSLVADHNHWDGRTAPMRSLGYSGLWELFVPGLTGGEKYKFELVTATGEVLCKTDPFGSTFELRPNNAAVVEGTSQFEWTDADWISQRVKRPAADGPMSVYEVHLGSWKQRDGHMLNYRELAHQLSDYCQEMAFTHVELMPVTEHPFDLSWGYQCTGYFAPTSRFGTPDDFRYFVNHLHSTGIGVIVDWVPGHFPSDAFALAQFDGTCLFEHADPRQGYHPHWNTLIFNFGRKEVSNFLIASALFWVEQMHIDGLRVDAVASMLYLDYGREEGEWIPNQYGGKENLEAIEFLKHLNSVIHQRTPGVLTIAEESTSFTGVTAPVCDDGLGFDMKWNMGWMNDTLRYFGKDPLFRGHHHDDLTFGLLYAFTERFNLVFSHDEVVHGKKSLLSKMPGDTWQQFANLRLLHSYMLCQPGKKLLFMGGEIGTWDEWNCYQEMQWFLLDFPVHAGINQCVQDLNHMYRAHSAFWERDFNHTGFEWCDFRDRDNSVVSYLRISNDETLLCVHHFTPSYNDNYYVPRAGVTSVNELFNSDAERYGGSGKQNGNPRIEHDDNGNPVGVSIQMPPLATMVFAITRQ